MLKQILIALGAVTGVLTVTAVIKKSGSVYKHNPEEQNPMEGKRVRFVENPSEPANADGVCGHLESIGDSNHIPTFYERVVKRGFDVILSLGGLIILSPVFLIITLWILIDDPGPVFFTQKRVGRDKQFFRLHKFRSMKMSTPANTPTHMLENPEQYITRSGRFIRSHSLEGNDIIGQTTESLVNKGFREVSPIHFQRGHDLFSTIADHANIEGILCQSA